MRNVAERSDVDSLVPARTSATSIVQKSIVQWTSRIVRAVSEALERHPNAVLACLLAGYLLTSVPTALLRPYWIDELVETYVCAQPSVAMVWHTLQTNPPTTDPPLHYLLTHLCLMLFGVHEWASRLPALCGFFVAIVCLYGFVRRRLGVALGAIAVLLLLTSDAMYYASEGRPYGVVMGCCGLLLLAWQSVGLGIRPKMNRVLVALALACAIASHYYGILFGLPVFAGEIVRSWRRRSVDWATFGAIAAGYLAMLVWIPFLPVAMAWKAHIWFVPAFENVMQMFGELADIQLITLYIAALFFVNSFTPAEGERRTDRPAYFRMDEAAAVLTLVLMPFIGFFVSKFASKLFLARYVIASSLGIVIAMASLGSLLKVPRRAWISIVAILLFCFVLGMKARSLHSKIDERKDFAANVHQLEQLPGPIAICQPHDFLPFYFYGSAAVKNKIYWLNDRDAALRYIKTDTDVRMMSAVQKVRDVHVVDLHSFLRAHPSFYVYQHKLGNYDIPMMLANGMKLTYLGTKAGGDFFHVQQVSK